MVDCSITVPSGSVAVKIYQAISLGSKAVPFSLAVGAPHPMSRVKSSGKSANTDSGKSRNTKNNSFIH